MFRRPTSKPLIHVRSIYSSPWVLHSMRSLFNTRTNSIPHELFFNFNRRNVYRQTLPSWLVLADKMFCFATMYITAKVIPLLMMWNSLIPIHITFMSNSVKVENESSWSISLSQNYWNSRRKISQLVWTKPRSNVRWTTRKESQQRFFCSTQISNFNTQWLRIPFSIAM